MLLEGKHFRETATNNKFVSRVLAKRCRLHQIPSIVDSKIFLQRIRAYSRSKAMHKSRYENTKNAEGNTEKRKNREQT